MGEQAGLAKRHDRGGDHGEAWAPQHAEPPVVLPVGVRHDWRRALRGPRLAFTYARGEEIVIESPRIWRATIQVQPSHLFSSPQAIAFSATVCCIFPPSNCYAPQ